MEPYVLLTPGPTPLPPSVYAKLAAPILHHRTTEFSRLFDQLLSDLKYVYRTENTVLMMTASGTGSMESAVANLLSAGDKTIVCTVGAFGDRFVKIHRAYGLAPTVLAEEWGRAADPERLKDALRSNPGTRAVYFQHVETSTGVVNDVKTLAQVVRDHSDDALIVVDAISGLAGEELETDAWGLDVVLTGSQKGLMNGPGLSFAALSERAWAAVEAAKLPRFLRLIKEEGIENVWKRTAALGAFTRQAAAQTLGLKLFAERPADILTAAWLPEGVDGTKLLSAMRAEDRVAVADGQGKLKGKMIRIAHMGRISRSDVETGIAALGRRLSAGAVR
ncbi:MAG: alanine--glyoxylate aminotransferase family protein [Elusimicrobia bacterium]|nr:alanine--glyoxylate aminotransferase family protein [Elusimicrobiota bacterium]